MRKIKSEPAHFAYIDALRGYAFLLVLLAHSASSVGEFNGNLFITYAGVCGVQLFFIISAFTLCNSLNARQESDRYPVLSFYIRRLFRIAPLFWIAMAFYWLVPGVAPAYWLQACAPPGGVSWEDFVLTGLFVNGWHPYTLSSIVPGGWSIAVEMNFYIIFPLLFCYLATTGRVVTAFLVTSCAIVFEPLLFFYLGIYRDTAPVAYYFFISHGLIAELPVFLLGIVLYQILLRRPSFHKNLLWSFCLLLVSVLAFCLLIPLNIELDATRFPFHILLSMALAGGVFALSGGRLTWLTNPVICYIGKISYSCYLVHFAALTLTLKIFGETLSPENRRLDFHDQWDNGVLFVLVLLIALIVTIGLSTLTLHWIENPGIDLGKKLIRYANRNFSPKRSEPILATLPGAEN